MQSIQTTDCLEYKINATFYKKKEMFKSHEIKEKNNGIDFFFRFVFREEKWHSIATAILTFVALNANSGGKCMRILLLWVCMAKVIYPKFYKKSNESCKFCFWVNRAVLSNIENLAIVLLLRDFLILIIILNKKLLYIIVSTLINTKLRKRTLFQIWL